MNFERKASQNQFLSILFKAQEKKFETVFMLEAISIMVICNQTHSVLQFMCNRIAILTTLDNYFYTSIDRHAFFKVIVKSGDTVL